MKASIEYQKSLIGHPLLHTNLLTYLTSVFQRFQLNGFNLPPSPVICFNYCLSFGGQN